MSDKLQAWCEEVLTEFYGGRLSHGVADELANILRNRTDFRLVEPLPEGAVPVRIYAAVDDRTIFVATKGTVFSETDTHQSIIDTFILPRVKTPIVNAEPKAP